MLHRSPYMIAIVMLNYLVCLHRPLFNTYYIYDPFLNLQQSVALLPVLRE